MKTSTMDVITKAWLQDKSFVDDIAFLLTQEVSLHSYLFDYYLEELINLRDNKTICLTPQGKLDTYHIEFKLRQAEKHRIRNTQTDQRCPQTSYAV